MFLMNNFVKDLSMCDLPPTLYSIMESMVNYDNPDPVKIKDLSTYAKEKIFNFYYPTSELFDKDRFEDLFLKHYMFRRINYDTFTSFQLHLEVKLNDIMPKYYKMLEGFKSVNFDGDVETHLRTMTDSKTTNTTSNISTTSDNSAESKFSNMPQDLIDDIKDDKYVTEYTQNNGTGSSSSNSTGNSTDNGNLEENITIKRADSIDEYKKYLEIMNNILSMIFKECDSLFYGLI